MIPTNTTESAQSWACRSCASVNPGWRLRCDRCGVIVGASSAVWGPPSPQHQFAPAPPKRTGSRVLGVVGCIVGAAVACAASVVGLQAYESATERRPAEERRDDFLFRPGEKEFFAADSQFRATFPHLPVRSTDHTDVDGAAFDSTAYVSTLRRDAFFVATIERPPGSLFDLNEGVNGAALGLDGRVESTSPTTWQGFDAIEAVLSEPSGMQVRMLMVLTAPRVYLVYIVSPNDPLDEYEKFKGSFEITL